MIPNYTYATLSTYMIVNIYRISETNVPDEPSHTIVFLYAMPPRKVALEEIKQKPKSKNTASLSSNWKEGMLGCHMRTYLSWQHRWEFSPFLVELGPAQSICSMSSMVPQPAQLGVFVQNVQELRQ